MTDDEAQATPSRVELPDVAFPEKVVECLRRGELGRAREILGSRMSQSGFDPNALEQLGQVLLQMRDDVNAGRYLFLSGRQCPAYGDAIAAFLLRCRKTDLRQFVSQWPAAVRRVRIADLSPGARGELSVRGITTEQLQGTLQDLVAGGVCPATWQKFVLLVAALVTIAFAVRCAAT